jgi:stage II sporulation protein D
MKRTGSARLFLSRPAILIAGLLSACLLTHFLAGCASGRKESVSSGSGRPDPTAKQLAIETLKVDTGYPTLPYPETAAGDSAGESAAFNSGLPGDSGLADSSVRPPDSSGWIGQAAPPATAVKVPSSGGRPEGIPKRPRPPQLPSHVHVLLSKSPKPLNFYSLGDMQILAEGSGKPAAITRLAVLKGRFIVRRSGTGFSIEQARKETVTTSSRKLRLISVNPYNLVDLGSAVYRGSMHIVNDPGGDILAVNVLGVEDYLRGVLPYELGTVDREALEALKAQAIVARTYAYKRMMRGGNPDFHIYSDVQDQVYKGVRGEYLLSDRAVWETRGMAVTHADTLALCYYYSTCGGRTASKDEVWGGERISYLISRPDTDDTGDPYCLASRYATWHQEWGLPQLSGILRRNLRSAGVPDYPSFSGLKSIDVLQRASCGRVRLLRFGTDRGPVQVKGDKVRWAMRPGDAESKILPSAWFDVKTEGGRVTAEGRGFGHGVGLCQVGAIGRARAKQNFREIIEAYYLGVQIVEFK